MCGFASLAHADGIDEPIPSLPGARHCAHPRSCEPACKRTHRPDRPVYRQAAISSCRSAICTFPAMADLIPRCSAPAICRFAVPYAGGISFDCEWIQVFRPGRRLCGASNAGGIPLAAWHHVGSRHCNAAENQLFPAAIRMRAPWQYCFARARPTPAGFPRPL
jgi:hypothetical protein